MPSVLIADDAAFMRKAFIVKPFQADRGLEAVQKALAEMNCPRAS
jgi:hypothetical protein